MYLCRPKSMADVLFIQFSSSPNFNFCPSILLFWNTQIIGTLRRIDFFQGTCYHPRRRKYESCC